MINAIAAVAGFPANERLVSAILTRADGLERKELYLAFRAISIHAPQSATVRSAFEKYLASGLEQMHGGKYGSPEKQKEFIRILKLSHDIELHLGRDLSQKISDIAENFRTPMDLRICLVRAFPFLSDVSPASVDVLVVWMGRVGNPFERPLAENVDGFVQRVRQRAERVKIVYAKLDSLLAALVKRWIDRHPTKSRHVNDSGFSGIRRSARQILEIQSAYSEFSAAVIGRKTEGADRLY
jgi:hypothetical protein